MVSDNVNKVWSISLSYFPMLLGMSYFYSLGYFAYFGIDISSYITFEDLIFIYAKIIYFVVGFLIVLVGILIHKWNSTQESHLDRTIGKSNFKIRAVVILIFAIVIVIVGYLSPKAYEFLANTFGIVCAILLAFFLFYIFFLPVHDNREISTWSILDYSGLFWGILFFFIFLPFLFGSGIASNSEKKSTLKIVFNDSTVIDINESNANSIIGRTHDYIFILDRKDLTIKIKHTTEIKEESFSMRQFQKK